MRGLLYGANRTTARDGGSAEIAGANFLRARRTRREKKLNAKYAEAYIYAVE
jgi:hypothetical protein